MLPQLSDPLLAAAQSFTRGAFQMSIAQADLALALDGESSVLSVETLVLQPGALLEWNGGAANLYGYAESENIGQSIGDLIVPHERKEEWFASREHEIESIFQKGNSSYHEITNRKRDGSLVPVEVTRSPVRNENGEVIAICAVTKDLTDRMRA